MLSQKDDLSLLYLLPCTLLYYHYLRLCFLLSRLFVLFLKWFCLDYLLLFGLVCGEFCLLLFLHFLFPRDTYEPENRSQKQQQPVKLLYSLYFSSFDKSPVRTSFILRSCTICIHCNFSSVRIFTLVDSRTLEPVPTRCVTPNRSAVFTSSKSMAPSRARA